MPPASGPALRRAIGRYDRAPLRDRLFVRGRAFAGDLTSVEAHVPRRGSIVELGCGHGLFSNLLIEASRERTVLGLDHDERKIGVARMTIQGRTTLRFEVADVVAVPPPRCDAIVIVDVLYLLPPQAQEQLLRAAGRSLEVGGVVVVRAQERRRSPRYAFGHAQELVAVGLGLTRSAGRGLSYQTRAEARAMFERAGLEVEVVERPGRPYTDVIYVARAASIASASVNRPP